MLHVPLIYKPHIGVDKNLKCFLLMSLMDILCKVCRKSEIYTYAYSTDTTTPPLFMCQLVSVMQEDIIHNHGEQDKMETSFKFWNSSRKNSLEHIAVLIVHYDCSVQIWWKGEVNIGLYQWWYSSLEDLRQLEVQAYR